MSEDYPQRDISRQPLAEIPSTPEDRQMAMFAHLGGLIAGFVPALVIWLMKKDQSPSINDQGKEALNFQINITGQAIILLIITAVTCGLGFILYIPWLVWPILMPILASVAANKGELYRYPAT